ncbi:MAG TPA: ThiF family adenylyltransferase [Candidatus Binatia bacterium]|nr:ThiF family adenylyltransferase [Candidatus Binatia bacterium]
MHVDYSGQTDIFDPKAFSWPVNVIGVGGIGSAVILPLVKLGLASSLHLWDPDFVEFHNVPAQLIYRASDVGRAKVEAAADVLRPYLSPSCELVLHQELVGPQTPLSGVVIGAVDNMKARSDIWEGVKFNPDIPLYLDGRIGGEQMQLLTLNPFDIDAIEYYEKTWLFPDEEGAELPCAARTVIHPPVVLAGHIIAQLTRFARDLPTRQYIDVHVGTTQFIVV